MRSLLFKTMWKPTWMIQAGVPLQAAAQSSPLMLLSQIIDVLPVKSTIVLLVNVSFIQILPAKSIEAYLVSTKKINNSWCLLKDLNLNSALVVNFGLKKIKDATTWPADANINSAMFAEVNTTDANVKALSMRSNSQDCLTLCRL